LTVVAAFELPAVIADFDEIAVMGQAASNAVILASPKTLGHSPKTRFVVTMMA